MPAKKELQIFGFVIISNHIHLIANSTTVNSNDTVREILKNSHSVRIIKEVINNPQEMSFAAIINYNEVCPHIIVGMQDFADHGEIQVIYDLMSKKVM